MKLKLAKFSWWIVLALSYGIICFKFDEVNAAKDYCSAKPKIQRPRKLPQCAISVDQLVREGPLHVGADGNFLNDVPEWFNLELAEIGQKFGRRNAFGIYYGMFMSFLFFIADPDIKKVMLNNGNVKKPEGAAKRYLTNLLQVELWLNEDLRGNKTNLFQSLNGVRSRHIVAAHKASRNDSLLRKPIIPEPKRGKNPYNIDLRIWKAFEGDLRASKIKHRTVQPRPKILMNQYGMAVAHFLHMGFPVITPKAVFIPDSNPRELEGFLHFWAFIGKAVGVEDEFNICLQPNARTAKIYIDKFFHETMVPTLFNLDYEAKVLFEFFFKGLNNAFSRIENYRRYEWNNLGDIFLLRLLEDVLNIPAPRMRSVLTPFERGSHGVLQALSRRYRNSRYQFVGNNVISRLMALWSELKFGVDTADPNDVAQNAFV